LLGPQSSWRAYILPRGGHASQDSTGNIITFDTASVASRFAIGNWIQVALATANLREVADVGGTQIQVSGANLTVAQNDRIFLIGNTQPTVTGGSATYTTPATRVYPRDDDTATALTNSMITSNSDGLIQGWANPNFYDVIIQDGNRANQGSIIDLAVGAVDGASFGGNVLIGGSLTVNGAIGVTGRATFGSTVTMNAALGVTGTATFGSTVTANAQLGVTGWATFGSTITANAAIGVTGHAVFGATVTLNSTLGVTGTAIFGSTVTLSSAIGVTGTAQFANIVGLLRLGTTLTITATTTINVNANTVRVRITGSTGGTNLNRINVNGAAPGASDDGRILLITNAGAGSISLGVASANIAIVTANDVIGQSSTSIVIWDNEMGLWSGFGAG